MRKLPLLVAGVLALALGVAGIAQAVNSKQGMKVSLTKNSAKKAKKAGVGTFTVALSLDERIRAIRRSRRRTTVVHFDKNLVFNYKKFPTCTPSQAVSRRGAVQEGEGGHGHGHRPGEHRRAAPENLTIKPTTARAASST